jgi:hypothetical protein
VALAVEVAVVVGLANELSVVGAATDVAETIGIADTVEMSFDPGAPGSGGNIILLSSDALESSAILALLFGGSAKTPRDRRTKQKRTTIAKTKLVLVHMKLT